MLSTFCWGTAHTKLCICVASPNCMLPSLPYPCGTLTIAYLACHDTTCHGIPLPYPWLPTKTFCVLHTFPYPYLAIPLLCRILACLDCHTLAIPHCSLPMLSYFAILCNTSYCLPYIPLLCHTLAYLFCHCLAFYNIPCLTVCSHTFAIAWPA